MQQCPSSSRILASAILTSVVLLTACERPPERGSPEDVASQEREHSSREEWRAERDERRTDTPQAERTIEVENFTALELRGTAEIEITVGPPASLQLSGSERVLKAVSTRVNGETLKIDLSKGRHWFSEGGNLKITLTVPMLKSLESNGAGDIEITGWNGGEHELRLAGAHNVKGTGRLDSLKLVLEGAGNVDFRNVPTADAKIEVNGAGNVEVNVSQSLRGEVNGVGAIRYTGNPQKVESDLHGLGTISARE